MSFLLLSLFLNKDIYILNYYLFLGIFIIFLGHSFISSSIFLLIGVINKFTNIYFINELRYVYLNNKKIYILLNILVFSNISLPLTINFLGEVLIFFTFINSFN